MEALAKCSSTAPIAPSLAAYRLLLSSKVVARERKGPMTLYMAPFDAQAGGRLWNLTPTRVVVVERDGSAQALVGSLYSKDFPMSERDIIGSFQGGLKRRIDLRPYPRAAFGGVQIQEAQLSAEPVFGVNHMLTGRLASGERLVICASKAELDAFGR